MDLDTAGHTATVAVGRDRLSADGYAFPTIILDYGDLARTASYAAAFHRYARSQRVPLLPSHLPYMERLRSAAFLAGLNLFPLGTYTVHAEWLGEECGLVTISNIGFGPRQQRAARRQGCDREWSTAAFVPAAGLQEFKAAYDRCSFTVLRFRGQPLLYVKQKVSFAGVPAT